VHTFDWHEPDWQSLFCVHDAWARARHLPSEQVVKPSQSTREVQACPAVLARQVPGLVVSALLLHLLDPHSDGRVQNVFGGAGAQTFCASSVSDWKYPLLHSAESEQGLLRLSSLQTESVHSPLWQSFDVVAGPADQTVLRALAGVGIAEA